MTRRGVRENENTAETTGATIKSKEAESESSMERDSEALQPKLVRQ
jgi:hypothetical protein